MLAKPSVAERTAIHTFFSMRIKAKAYMKFVMISYEYMPMLGFFA